MVVIPPEGDTYYIGLPTTSQKAFFDANRKLFEFSCTTNYYHYYNLPDGRLGWMTMELNDMYVITKSNFNLKKLGWNSNDATYVEGTVVISFSPDSRGTEDIYLYEPYDMDIVKMLVRELAEARTIGYPTHERISEGIYKSLPLMSLIMVQK